MDTDLNEEVFYFMFYYMDMPFVSEEIAKNAMGSIQMYYIGETNLGYVNNSNCKYRKYTFVSTDLDKLNLINNAIDGSMALAVDTGDTYILCNKQWQKCNKGASSWQSIE